MSNKILYVLVLVLTLAPTLAFGQVIDLTAADSDGEHNSALFFQGELDGSGTGVLDPFYRVKKSSSSVVQGVNTGNGTVQFETEKGTWTTELLLSTIPTVEIDGVVYREFVLDINQTAGAAIYDLTDVQIYTDNQSDLNCLDPTTQTWGACDDDGDSGLVYWLDGPPEGDATIRMNYSLEAGSGKGDLTMLVPDSNFNAGPECDYGAEGCDTYVYHYSSFSGNDDGFEEWATLIRPFIRIAKTAEGSADETHTWDITKTVNPDECDLFVGDSCTVDYKITVDETVEVSNALVEGVITISVPNKLPDDDEDAEDAVVTSLEDVFRGVNATIVGCDVPFTVSAGSTVECSYSLVPPDTDDGYDNVATAMIEGSSVTHEATASVSYDFNVIGYDVVNVTDDDGVTQRNFGPLDDGEMATYSEMFTCDDENDFERNNTATIDETGDSDDASVDIDCYALSVTKTANTSLVRENKWEIEKTVDPAQWDLFTGDSGTSKYTVSWTKTSMDAQFMVTGKITISNPAPMAAELTDVTDVVTPGPTAATVDCGGVTSVPAGDSIECMYEASPGDDSGTLNTATATMQNYAYDSAGVGTPDGTTDYSGTAAVDFSGATVTESNATVDIDDTVQGLLGDDVSDSGSTMYTRKFTCDGDEGTHDNTATIIGDGGAELDSDDASVVVKCYTPTVAKTANTSFTRKWDWTIDKSADASDITIAEGQTYVVNYEVTVDATSTDSDWAVEGQITISNPNPERDAVINSLSDVISPATAATIGACVGDQDGVAGAPYVVANGTDLVCDYSADLPDGSDQTNTATASLQNYDYDSNGDGTASGTTDLDGDAAVDFSTADLTEIDECVDVNDTNSAAPLGTVCADEAPKTFSYSISFGTAGADVTVVCGDNEHPNVADFETNDTGTTGSDNWNVIIRVDCDPSCTLTQGYWKTHNPSFWGGAPHDDTWLEILPDAEQSPFFLSGDTWFGVFWTPPKGNAYYNLAHQYMAAVLNTLNEASVPDEVQDALDDATALFETYTPAQVDSFKGKKRKEFIKLAGILAQYNEGLIGPGHCDEDGTGNLPDEDSKAEEGSAPTGAAAATDLAEIEGADDDSGAIKKKKGSKEEVAMQVADDAVNAGDDAGQDEIPLDFAIGNYPDPFNPVTTIELQLPEAAEVSLFVYDILGRRLAELANGKLPAGVHQFNWNATGLSSGTYFYVIRSGDMVVTKRMALSK